METLIRRTSDVTSLNLNVFVESLQRHEDIAENKTYINNLPGITDEKPLDDSEDYYPRGFKGE